VAAVRQSEWRWLAAEGTGTFFLVLVAAGAGVVDAVTGGGTGRCAAALAPGVMVLALIYTLGETSGAHLNPAVTPAFAARGNFPWRRVPAYLAAQLAGPWRPRGCSARCSVRPGGWEPPGRGTRGPQRRNREPPPGR
jgi:aquaporin Z